MTLALVLAEVVYQPCKGIEEGSWEWWLKGCWMLTRADVALLVGVTLALMVGAALWSKRQTRQVSA